MRLIISFFFAFFFGGTFEEHRLHYRRNKERHRHWITDHYSMFGTQLKRSCTFNGAGSAVSQEIWLDNKEIRSGKKSKDTAACFAGFPSVVCWPKKRCVLLRTATKNQYKWYKRKKKKVLAIHMICYLCILLVIFEKRSFWRYKQAKQVSMEFCTVFEVATYKSWDAYIK